MTDHMSAAREALEAASRQSPGHSLSVHYLHLAQVHAVLAVAEAVKGLAK